MAGDVEPLIPVTDFERRFERARVGIGLALAPIVFVAILLYPFSSPDLRPEAHRLAAVMGAVVTLWITEALPLPVTALLGASACTLLRVADAKTVFAPFADQLMFLFVGSFILARAIFLHGLDKRLAFGVMSLAWVGARPARILLAYGAVTACISAWISNTATTAMMMAIGLSILHFLFDPQHARALGVSRGYATGMMLMTSFAASIGGLATPVGTAPNVIGLGFIRKFLGVEISFFEWMIIGVPVVVILYLYLFVYMNWFCPAGVRELAGSGELLEKQRDSLGPWTAGQISTLVAFLITVALWIAPGVVALTAGEESPTYKLFRESCPEGVAALIGAALLFLLPGKSSGRAITWPEAVQIDWGVVLLYGGGFALGELTRITGLADAVGKGLAGWIPLSGDLGLLLASTVVAALVSETTSNTASANIVVPLVISLAQAAGVDPLAPALGATFGASLGFMLPVSTPCNAIVYGTGYIPLSRMIRYGLLLDVVGVAVIVTLIHALVPLLRS
ncbi:MAG: DASS family sodium-coupled anion symporter [Planctomycetia bacterium]|nr:DASS family sodium-coupled anion symporter [Planctomycetia bacterium]